MRTHDPGEQAIAANQEQPITLPNSEPYRCRNANFASYLVAANLLRYWGAELVPASKDVVFLFYDPESRGPNLLRNFNGGVADPVNARVLYEVRGYLLSEAKRILDAAGVRHAQKS